MFTGRVRTLAQAQRALSTLSYETVDVFTNKAFGGNPLAVCFGGEALDTPMMLQVAAEFNYSETTFVLPPTDSANTASVRIFTPVAELPFAGHPNVGTAFVLARRGNLFGKDLSRADELVFEEQAGLVRLSLLREAVEPEERGGVESGCNGAILTAPKPFATSGLVARAEAAACCGLEPTDLLGDAVIGSTGGEYALAALASRDALGRCRAVPAAFARSSQMSRIGKLLVYLPVDGAAGRLGDRDGDLRGQDGAHRSRGTDRVDIRCRMFTARGTEDPATGAANTALLGLMGKQAAAKGGAGTLRRVVAQGVEMGRPSQLLAECDYSSSAAGGVIAVRVGGQCVPMMRGELTI